MIKTTSKYIKECQSVHGDKYDYSLVEYIDWKTKVKIICPVHGIFEQVPSSHLQGHGCSKCARCRISNDQKKTTSKYIKECQSVHGDKYDYSLVEYIGAHNKVKIICPVHGVFEQNAVSHLQGHGCSKCSYNNNSYNQKFNTDWFIDKSRNNHGDKYDYSLVEYDNIKSKVKIICPVHGIFEQVADYHIRGNGCPKCGSSISQQEIELQEWLGQYVDIKVNDRSLISPLELDIVITSHNIAIEYNGLYWHREQMGKDSKYHLNKYNSCKDKGYRLISIWENEWVLKKDIVKSIILNSLNICDKKIHGRKCEVNLVQSPIARQFYEDNHIQGFKGGVHHGLYYENELVSLMTIDSKGELQRFVNKKNILVHGSFTKLLKSFNIKDIYTFADLRYFTGNVYKSNGFIYDGNIKPRYWYFKHHSLDVIHRRRFQKQYIQSNLNLTFDPNLTEYQNMINNGYDRIWDCGRMRFTYKGE